MSRGGRASCFGAGGRSDAVRGCRWLKFSRSRASLGQGYSALLYGSAARGDYIPGRSNINLMLVIDQITPKVLRSLGRGFTGWRKAGREPPLVLSRTEWDRASDAFPIEITDMRTAYKVLRGADPLQGARVDPADLRKALERELRGSSPLAGVCTYAPEPASRSLVAMQTPRVRVAAGLLLPRRSTTHSRSRGGAASVG